MSQRGARKVAIVINQKPPIRVISGRNLRPIPMRSSSRFDEIVFAAGYLIVYVIFVIGAVTVIDWMLNIVQGVNK